MSADELDPTKVTSAELLDAVDRLAAVTNPGVQRQSPPSPEGLAVALQLLQVEATRKLTEVLDGLDSRIAGVCDDGPDYSSALRVREG